MKIMIKQQLLQVTMLLNQLGEAYRHINDLEELLQKKKKKEEDEVMNGLFEKKEEEEEEKKEKEEKEGVLTNSPKEGERSRASQATILLHLLLPRYAAIVIVFNLKLKQLNHLGGQSCWRGSL